MTDATFWDIIARSSAENQDEQSKRLAAELSKLNQDELMSFEGHYRAKLRQAYHWDLWAAAYIINGGASDDSFAYFCDWLISRGQTVFENARENPETLIDIATPWDTEFEDFRYIMIEVMEEKFSGEFPRPSESWPASPAGEAWDEETVNDKYPKLAAWVDSNLSTPPAPSSPSPSKPGFWQRLFGKS
jgi:hypothetical protein